MVLKKFLKIVLLATTTNILTRRHGQWVNSFHITPALSSHHVRSSLSSFQGKLFAKPPPTTNFDLDAIEAFEKELEMKSISTQMELKENTPLNDIIDDWEVNAGNENDDQCMYYTVPLELHKKRIDAIISKARPKLTRSQCVSLVTDGMVSMKEDELSSASLITKKSTKIEHGSILRIKHKPTDIPTEIVAQDLPINIIFEDEHIIILNKAAGMVVHPAAGNWDGTVVNALAYYLAKKSPFGSGEFIDSNGKVKPINGEKIGVEGTDGEVATFRPGIVHRLDKGTTGVLVVAKTSEALSKMSEAFANRNVKKTYIAVTVGNPGRRVVINKPIGRHPLHRQKMRVVPDPSKKDSSRLSPMEKPDFDRAGKSSSTTGRRALSFVNTLAFDGKLSVVQIRIETGRTHQIRVHLQDRHTPVYGDDVYGLPDWNKRLKKQHGVERPLLHAFRLEMNHPITGEKMSLCAPLADNMARVALATWPTANIEIDGLFDSSEK